MRSYRNPSPSLLDLTREHDGPNDMSISSSKKSRELVPEKIYDTLLGVRTADKVTMHFKDGRVVHGALIFNRFKGTGRVINIDQEVSVDFNVAEIRDLKV
jgi:hypothetical protein